MCRDNPDWNDKVKINLRLKTEVLTTRGGQAPNAPKKLPLRQFGCKLPAIQVVIRPDGLLSLCCNDALGKVTLGDLKTHKLLDIWNDPKNVEFRCRNLEEPGTELCRHCDSMV
jgi:radical SAM protein with 4Fe4S-binding SPASM domain